MLKTLEVISSSIVMALAIFMTAQDDQLRRDDHQPGPDTHLGEGP